MYTKEEKRRALELYDKLGVIEKTSEKLGYPHPYTLSRWIAQRSRASVNTVRKRRRPDDVPLKEKLDALRRVDAGEDAVDVAAALGVQVRSLVKWRRLRDERGACALIPKSKAAPARSERPARAVEESHAEDANVDGAPQAGIVCAGDQRPDSGRPSNDIQASASMGGIPDIAPITDTIAEYDAALARRAVELQAENERMREALAQAERALLLVTSVRG